MIVGEDFKFRDDKIKDKTDTVPIELLTGPFKGVILKYIHVVVKENRDQTATLQFDYDLLKIPKDYSEVGLREDKRFQKHAGLVLNALILEAVGTESKEKSLNEHRVNNPQELDIE